MANVFTKKSSLPMAITLRDYTDRAHKMPVGSLVAVIKDPSLKLPTYERSTGETLVQLPSRRVSAQGVGK